MIGWTVAEALAELHPRVSRRTLVRIIEAAGVQPTGRRRPVRGRPAFEYQLADLQRAHAAWARGDLSCASEVGCP